jgi:DhnA family fructose-bisphosphate aldolase class Ia
VSLVVDTEIVDHAGGGEISSEARVLKRREGAFDSGAEGVGGRHT